MFNFKTIKCTNCGSVVFNLPEMEAKKLHNFDLKCEDCNFEVIKNIFESDYVYDLKEVKCTA
ncbi:hypothetical protein [Pseudobacteroides cellulosolvens]|uniref:Uncharacterized protein n=1 Tax=Pseudobacteroides cellulosolvens ATCC 35603 = DSM 2933 TaxID=398512 RepID=A0A0L6JMN3_9FIRM|nr:hypothetical protein [Pseudobacteroides cellulosolvens]KNY27056.1 hypothetical protein Bccel_2321 [Pseudobacteroides cellulosolvens ATCC 35603 = DSM 2933]